MESRQRGSWGIAEEENEFDVERGQSTINLLRMSTSVPTCCCPLIRIFKRAKIQTEPFLPRSSRSQGDSAGRGGEGTGEGGVGEGETEDQDICASRDLSRVRVYLWKSRFPRLELLNEGRMWREGERGTPILHT